MTSIAVAPPTRRERNVERPPRPETVSDTGLAPATISDLLLKALHVGGDQTGRELARRVALPFSVIDGLLLQMQHNRLIQVLGAEASGRPAFEFGITEKGRGRAKEAMSVSRYVGAAPVPLSEFRRWVSIQSRGTRAYGRQDILEALEGLELHDGVVDALGPAVNSGTSLFLYGHPGNGKTAIAERIGQMVSGELYLPRAVEVGGQIMVLFDPVYHELVDEEEEVDPNAIFHTVAEYDRRYAKIHRPTVMVGGELTLDQLDLEYDAVAGIYHAPFQLKASGGVLVIDDFGRQRVRPEDLLNRWIVPLEKQIDFLSLRTGTKFRVPFDCLLVFSTNLDPSDLVDEAFLRRIEHKVHVVNPDRDRYAQIFRDVCEAMDVGFEASAVDRLFEEFYEGLGIPPRGCHPRDILSHLHAMARYEGTEISVSPDRVTLAAERYFQIVRSEEMLRAERR